MGERTNIGWCDHTFNPWIGCQKVSPACDNCYAETLMDKRYHKVEWGPGKERKRTSAANWKLPLRWAKEACAEQAIAAIHDRPPVKRRRVFCASLADVFDNAVPEEWRNDLWRLIAATPELDWLLLTKRPQNVAKMLPDLDGGWPQIWLGTTAENQEEADRRIPHLLRASGIAVRFVSCEPMLGYVDFRHVRAPTPSGSVVFRAVDALTGTQGHMGVYGFTPSIDRPLPRLDWIIFGGETGAGHREMKEEWLVNGLEQCEAANVPAFVKQMSGRAPIPPHLMVREFPR